MTAGCKPEYLPVVIAAVEAACTNEFNMHSLLATTMPSALGTSTLAIDPTTPTTLYAGTDRGVFSIQQVSTSQNAIHQSTLRKRSRSAPLDVHVLLVALWIV